MAAWQVSYGSQVEMISYRYQNSSEIFSTLINGCLLFILRSQQIETRSENVDVYLEHDVGWDGVWMSGFRSWSRWDEGAILWEPRRNQCLVTWVTNQRPVSRSSDHSRPVEAWWPGWPRGIFNKCGIGDECEHITECLNCNNITQFVACPRATVSPQFSSQNSRQGSSQSF